MIECEVCFDEYQEGTLDQHRETCVLRLVFRCSVCGEDYVSREGLWNHLDLHDILGGITELHYDELKAKYKLYQCTLCNDQRAYSKNCYLMHVNNFHGNGGTPGQMVASDFNVLIEEPASISDEHGNSEDEPLIKLRVKQACEGLDRLKEESHVDLVIDTAKCTNKESESTIRRRKSQPRRGNVYQEHDHMHILKDENNIPEDGIAAVHVTEGQTPVKRSKLGRPPNPTVRNERGEPIWPCPMCKLVFLSKSGKFRHMKAHRTKPEFECSFCQKTFYRHDIRRVHEKLCAEKRCLECKIKFCSRARLIKHNLDKHSHDNQSKNEEVADSGNLETVKKRREKALVRRNAGDDYPCPVCGRTFTKQTSMWSHKVQTHTEPRHKCTFCQTLFHTAYKLRRHEELCSAKRCQECGIMFGSRALFYVHRISEHSPNKKSIGAECPENATKIQETRAKDKKPRTKKPKRSTASKSRSKKTKEYEELEMDIKVEDTVLQDQEYYVSTQNIGRLSTSKSVEHKETIFGSEADQQAPQDHITDSEMHVGKQKEANSRIVQKIGRWTVRNNINIPDSHIGVRWTGNKATVKCWYCPRAIALSYGLRKNGFMFWNVYNFTRHILNHMKSPPAVKEVNLDSIDGK